MQRPDFQRYYRWVAERSEAPNLQAVIGEFRFQVILHRSIKASQVAGSRTSWFSTVWCFLGTMRGIWQEVHPLFYSGLNWEYRLFYAYKSLDVLWTLVDEAHCSTYHIVRKHCPFLEHTIMSMHSKNVGFSSQILLLKWCSSMFKLTIYYPLFAKLLLRQKGWVRRCTYQS